jgi:CheY-like chemotaxis protein
MNAIMNEQILVVDDDAAVRKILCRVLADEGYRVREATRGAEALEITAAGEIDLMLLDLKLPEKNGWEIFERLTKDHPLLPVIIVTGRSNQLFPALASGVGALVEKPIDFPALLQTVSRLLGESPETRRVRLAGQTAQFIYNSPRKQGSPA